MQGLHLNQIVGMKALKDLIIPQLRLFMSFVEIDSSNFDVLCVRRRTHPVEYVARAAYYNRLLGPQGAWQVVAVGRSAMGYYDAMQNLWDNVMTEIGGDVHVGDTYQ